MLQIPSVLEIVEDLSVVESVAIECRISEAGSA